MPESLKSGTGHGENDRAQTEPERRIGPKGILALLCAISLLVFADRGTHACIDGLHHLHLQMYVGCAVQQHQKTVTTLI